MKFIHNRGRSLFVKGTQFYYACKNKSTRGY